MTPGAAGNDPRAYCLFTSESQPFAVDLDVTAEVVTPGRLAAVPLVPSWVRGVCVYRGGIVPVVDPGMGKRERVSDSDSDRVPLVLMLRTAQGHWGIAIDRNGISIVKDDGDRAANASSSTGPPVLVGVIHHDAKDYAIVDSYQTWGRLRGEIERWYGDVTGL